MEREFGSMDVVSIRDLQGREFARGIAAYASDERINEGKKTAARVLFTRENIVVLEAAG